MVIKRNCGIATRVWISSSRTIRAAVSPIHVVSQRREPQGNLAGNELLRNERTPTTKMMMIPRRHDGCTVEKHPMAIRHRFITRNKYYYNRDAFLSLYCLFVKAKGNLFVFQFRLRRQLKDRRLQWRNTSSSYVCEYWEVDGQYLTRFANFALNIKENTFKVLCTKLIEFR